MDKGGTYFIGIIPCLIYYPLVNDSACWKIQEQQFCGRSNGLPSLAIDISRFVPLLILWVLHVSRWQIKIHIKINQA